MNQKDISQMSAVGLSQPSSDKDSGCRNQTLERTQVKDTANYSLHCSLGWKAAI